MKPPFWKKCLSYLIDIPIETRSSEHNPVLQIDLVKGRYQLCSENAIYSFADLYDNFRDAFRQLDWKKMQVNRVLVLGFGLGSIPYMLEKTFHRQFHYTAIEIDEEVLVLAKEYVLSELDSPMELICTDAYTFVQTTEQKFDLIAIDLFMDDVIPVKFESPEFLEMARQLLTPNGVLLYNRLAFSPNDKDNTRAFFDQQFKQVFENGTFLEVKRNWILLNDQQFKLSS